MNVLLLLYHQLKQKYASYIRLCVCFLSNTARYIEEHYSPRAHYSSWHDTSIALLMTKLPGELFYIISLMLANSHLIITVLFQNPTCGIILPDSPSIFITLIDFLLRYCCFKMCDRAVWKELCLSVT